MDSLSNEKLIQPNQSHYVSAIPSAVRAVCRQTRKCTVNAFFQVLPCPLPIFDRWNWVVVKNSACSSHAYLS
jgi:hypothetical protein